MHSPGMMSFLERSAESPGCWEWPGWTDKDGYGRVQADGKTAIAHRVAYTLAHGPIPTGMNVCHRCDNPACCRPSHFFLGTQRDNCQDAKAKDRHSRGTRNGIAKLDDDAVRDIRARAGSTTQWALADEYGVWQGTIWHVIHGKRWQHVL